MFPSLPSIPDMIREHHESQRKPNPGVLEPALPEDQAAFWATLDQHGWASEHDVAAVSEEGYTFLSFVLFYCPELMGQAVAVFQQHPQAAEIINRPDPHGHHEGWTPLHWAVRLFQGQPWVSTLLELGADVSLPCNDRDTAPEECPQALGLLMLSFNPRTQQFYQPDMEASRAAAVALLEAGADMGYVTSEELARPIHGAAQFAGHLLPLVLEHPVGCTTINAIDGFAQTPLVRALISQPAVVQLLLDAGADPTLDLPRKDGVFRNASDVARKLLEGVFQTPHAHREDSRAIWKAFRAAWPSNPADEQAEAPDDDSDD